MEDLIIFLIQFFLEVVLQILAELPWDWILRWREVDNPAKGPGPAWMSVTLGAGLGFVSLWILPRSLISSALGRIVHLFLSPLVCAGAALLLASIRRARSSTPQPDIWLHAKCALWFAIGLTTVRFAYVHRPAGDSSAPDRPAAQSVWTADPVTRMIPFKSQ
ncbi:MAG TPA: hypothetical protein DCM86_17070 [Verrucomicrobiales bacterium]|mgnify:CR=1 FL=1|nr:hypothetical protein [Verrucomicrobiales bacterium]